MIGAGIVTATATVIFALTYTNTVSAGVLILSALVGVGTVVGVIRGARFKAAFEAERAYRETIEAERDDLKQQRAELQASLDASTAALLDAQRMIDRLEPLKDMGRVLEMITKTFERLRDRQEDMHVENRLQKDQQTQLILEEVRAGRAV